MEGVDYMTTVQDWLDVQVMYLVVAVVAVVVVAVVVINPSNVVPSFLPTFFPRKSDYHVNQSTDLTEPAKFSSDK